MSGGGQEAGKPSKSLFVWDMDNTLCDSLTTIAGAIDNLYGDAARLHGVDHARIIEEVTSKKPDGSDRFTPSERIDKPAWTLEQLDILKADREGPEARKFADAHAELIHAWERDKNGGLEPYAGAAETLHDIKQQGGRNVIYTDAITVETWERMYKLGINLDDIDHVSAIESEDPTTAPLFDADSPKGQYFTAIRAKTRMRGPDDRKKVQNELPAIMERFAATPEETVMIGDTSSDGFVAKQAGVDFAHQEMGVHVGPKTISVFNSLYPSYPIGPEGCAREFAKQEITPAFVLPEGPSGLLAAVTVAPGSKPAVPARSAPGRTRNPSLAS